MTSLQKLTISASEAAVVLGVTPPTIYSWVREGEIPSVRLGGCIRIPTAKLADLLGVDVETLFSVAEQSATKPESEKRP